MKFNFLASLITAFSFSCVTIVPAQNHNHGHSHDHSHHHHQAPHGGTLVVFGKEAAHLEVVLDNKEGKLTGYVLNNEADTAIRIKQPAIELVLAKGDLKSTTMPFTLKAVANPLTGEKSGDTSQFEGKNEHLKKLKKFHLTVQSIEIKGTKFEKTVSPFPEGNHD